MKKLMIALICIVYAISVSGCLTAALIGGAVAGMHGGRNYDIVKKEDEEATTEQTDEADQQTDADQASAGDND